MPARESSLLSPLINIIRGTQTLAQKRVPKGGVNWKRKLSINVNALGYTSPYNYK